MTADSGGSLFRLGFLTAIEVPERGFVGGLLITNHFGRPLEFQCTAPLKPNRTQEILYGPTLVPYLLGDLIGRTLIEKVGIKPHLVLTERGDLLPLRDLVEVPIACVEDAAPSASEAGPSNPKVAIEKELLPSPKPLEVDSSENATADVGGAQTGEPTGESAVGETAAGLPNSQSSDPASSTAPVTAPDGIPTVATPTEADSAPASTTSELRLGRQILRFHAEHGDDRAVAKRGAGVVPADADLREPFERVREALNETARSGGVR